MDNKIIATNSDIVFYKRFNFKPFQKLTNTSSRKMNPYGSASLQIAVIMAHMRGKKNHVSRGQHDLAAGCLHADIDAFDKKNLVIPPSFGTKGTRRLSELIKDSAAVDLQIFIR